jgi:hypothetical protein
MSDNSIAKHTPGPWKSDGPRIYADGRCLATVGTKVFEVAQGKGEPWTCAYDRVKPMREAAEIQAKNDALLIATAPDMFALLVESQSSIGGDWRERRDAVVAKAGGAA